jgi:hypothetical protein
MEKQSHDECKEVMQNFDLISALIDNCNSSRFTLFKQAINEIQEIQNKVDKIKNRARIIYPNNEISIVDAHQIRYYEDLEFIIENLNKINANKDFESSMTKNKRLLYERENRLIAMCQLDNI